MAGLNWLQSLFSSSPSQPAGSAPQARVGNVYQGTSLPAGKSSLLAMSEDLTKKAAGGREAKQAKRYDRNLAKRAELGGVSPEQVRYGDQIMGEEANRLMKMLFGDAEQNRWGMPRNDREADRLLDDVGYFDPRGGGRDDRNARAIAEWQRRYGFGGR